MRSSDACMFSGLYATVANYIAALVGEHLTDGRVSAIQCQEAICTYAK